MTEINLPKGTLIKNKHSKKEAVYEREDSAYAYIKIDGLQGTPVPKNVFWRVYEVIDEKATADSVQQ